MRILVVIFACLLSLSIHGFADDRGKKENISDGAEGLGAETFLAQDSLTIIRKQVFPGDSTLSDPKKKKLQEPTYEAAGGLLTFWIGVIALVSGAFSPVGILIAGGIFLLVGIFLLIFYTKIKKANPFKLKGRNIIGRIILALFFFIFLLVLIGAIIISFVVALALLLTALLSSVVSPVVVAGVIMGAGVLWLLINAIRYLIKRKRYKRSLK